MLELKCGVQRYDWGQHSPEGMVSKLKGVVGKREDKFVTEEEKKGLKEHESVDERPFAELWLGVHHRMPSYVIIRKRLRGAFPEAITATVAAGREKGEEELDPDGQQMLVPLKEFLLKNKDRYLGRKHVERFGLSSVKFESKSKVADVIKDSKYNYSVLPFLFKVFSIGKPLSVQLHPSKEWATLLHTRDPKNYPDAIHRPELVVALTRFEGFCCLRPIHELLYFIKQSPPFLRILGEDIVKNLEAVDEYDLSSDITPLEARQALRAALTRLYKVDPYVISGCVQEQLRMIKSGKLLLLPPVLAPRGPSRGGGVSLAGDGGVNGGGSPSSSHGSFLDKQDVMEKISHPCCRRELLDATHQMFVKANESFPGDVGLWVLYFMNYFVLEPGEGHFLAADEPHTYLSGDAIEISSNSDNVVRAGLTPKFKDVPTLVDMLKYDTKCSSRVVYKARKTGQHHPPQGCDKSEENSCRAGPHGASVGENGSFDTAVVQQYQPPPWCKDFCLFVVRLKAPPGPNKTDEASTREAVIDLPSVAIGLCVSGRGKVICEGINQGGDDDEKEIEMGTKFILPKGRAEFTLSCKGIKRDPKREKPSTSEEESECVIFIGTTNLHHDIPSKI